MTQLVFTPAVMFACCVPMDSLSSDHTGSEIKISNIDKTLRRKHVTKTLPPASDLGLAAAWPPT